jgi:hypothetical protein
LICSPHWIIRYAPLTRKTVVTVMATSIFGGSINAFTRYENGKTKPPLALVNLLKVLDRHPDLLNEVRTA